MTRFGRAGIELADGADILQQRFRHKGAEQPALFLLLLTLGEIIDDKRDAVVDLVIAAQGTGDHLPIALAAMMLEALRPNLLGMVAADALDRFEEAIRDMGQNLMQRDAFGLVVAGARDFFGRLVADEYTVLAIDRDHARTDRGEDIREANAHLLDQRHLRADVLEEAGVFDGDGGLLPEAGQEVEFVFFEETGHDAVVAVGDADNFVAGFKRDCQNAEQSEADDALALADIVVGAGVHGQKRLASFSDLVDYRPANDAAAGCGLFGA